MFIFYQKGPVKATPFFKFLADLSKFLPAKEKAKNGLDSPAILCYSIRKEGV